VTIDPALVTRKLTLIAGDLDAVGEVAAKSREAFVASAFDQRVAERLLERMIGRMIDVNFHLLVEQGHPPPADYYTSFLRLADLGVVDAAFARRLAPSAGLRNRLVHEYDAIDPGRLFDALAPARTDIVDYVRAVEAYLTRGGG
jgi:uncharacterized protein YutE (UPF0331/DUF86 family)